MDFNLEMKSEKGKKFNNHRKFKTFRQRHHVTNIKSSPTSDQFFFRKSRLMELEIETLKEQNYMLTEKLSQLINMTIGSFHILDVSLALESI